MAKLHVRRRSLAGAQDGEISHDFELDPMDICESGHGDTLLDRGPPPPEHKLPATLRGAGKRLRPRSSYPRVYLGATPVPARSLRTTFSPHGVIPENNSRPIYLPRTRPERLLRRVYLRSRNKSVRSYLDVIGPFAAGNQPK
jgi:hypothetical protein